MIGENGGAFERLPGAVGSPPEHYGNPLGEQARLASGDAVVDLADRAVLSITGEDRLTWLDSLTSQSIAKLAPGESAETLLLEAAEAVGLHAWLSKMVFMLRVSVADRSAEFATIGTLGAPGVVAAEPNGVPLVWRDPWVSVARGGHQYSLVAEHPSSGWTYSEILVARDALDAVAALPVAGTLALEALRIAAWRPRLKTEADERTIPHELDWLRSAVHLTKGCYRGQETVAKVHNLGHPPRRLVLLHLDGSDGVLPAHGDVVLAGDAEVGRVTSVALHYELGPIALAVVKRSTDPDADLIVRTADLDIAAAQEIIVPPSAGAEADIPKLPRLRATAAAAAPGSAGSTASPASD